MFNKSINEHFAELLVFGQFADVQFRIIEPTKELKVDENINTKSLSAHKCILAISSPVFEKMFYSQNFQECLLNEISVVKIDDIDYDTFQLFLK